MSLTRYLTASALAHLLMLFAARSVTLERRARAERLATARASNVHMQRFENERRARQLAEARRWVGAVERVRSATASGSGAHPSHTDHGDSRAPKSVAEPDFEVAHELARRLERAAASPSSAEEIATLHARARELAEGVVKSAPVGRASGAWSSSVRSGESSSAAVSGSRPEDGWTSSLVAENWAELETAVRGPAILAEQRQRWKQQAYDARLDAELAGWETWLKPKRSFLGRTSGVSWFCVDTWYVLGPFDNTDRKAHDTHFPPETLVDLDAVYTGKGGRALRWQYVQTGNPLIVPPTDASYAISYAYTELRSDRERQVWFAVGGDDSLKVWLNQELIFESEVHLKPWAIAEGFARAKLSLGYNALLVRLENAPQGSAFSVSIRLEP